MIEPIPVDDIAEVYSSLVDSKRSAITNVVRSVHHIGVSSGEITSDMPPLIIDWEGPLELSGYMILHLIEVGTKLYGEVWLNALKRHLSQKG